jgi:hypothetical protein
MRHDKKTTALRSVMVMDEGAKGPLTGVHCASLLSSLESEPEFVNLLRSPGIDFQPGGIDSLESIPGLLIRLQIRALSSTHCSKDV